MTSQSTVEVDKEITPLLPHDNSSLEEVEIVKEISEFLKFGKREQEHETGEELVKSAPKRRKKNEEKEKFPPLMLAEVFMRIYYPISACLSKSVSAGLMKSLDYAPTVLLSHGTKNILFSHEAWDSFLKHLHLIEVYLTNSVCGRKTNIRLLDCDNVIDIVKHRGHLQVRIRNLTQHENKILLTRQEFLILSYVSKPLSRYMKQLVFARPVIIDYLVDALETKPDKNIPSGQVDTSIFNRIPHEVRMWRELRDFNTSTETTEEIEDTLHEEEEEEEEVEAKGLEV